MSKLFLVGTMLWALLGASSSPAQTTCGNIQLQLSSDYSFAIGSSSGGDAYTFTRAGQTLAEGTPDQLALFHYDGSLTSTSGIAPAHSSGTSFVPGKRASALTI